MRFEHVTSPEALKEKKAKDSVTSMYDCTHGPKKDCAQCLIPEMAAALEMAVEWRDKLAASPASQEAWEALVEEDGCLDNEARAVLEKAKLLDDCIPAEEAAEAALDHGHPHE